jgi:drug/metabolite transporter (DMT)-like permease
LAAILAATAGVIAMSGNPLRNGVDLRATLYGIAAGAGFGVSAVCYRGGILELGEASFFLAATTALAVALFLQASAMIAWFAWRDPATLARVFGAWRRSAFAGLMGACASAGWFSGFALAPAALVRTLALVEVFFSMLVGRNMMAQRLTGAEAFGLALIVAGVTTLLLFG